VLILNVLRISAVVKFGADKPAGWNVQVLHDTMGIFMLLAVALVHIDALIWRSRALRRKRQVDLAAVGDDIGEAEDKQRKLPMFWRLLFRWWWAPVAVAAVAAVIVLPVWKLRPPHRAEMIRGVAEGLIERDPENAERAVRAALRLAPGNGALHDDLAAILLERRKFDQALVELRRKPATARTLQERVLEARALLALKRVDEVWSIVNGFAPASKDLPGVAMILAEFSYVLDRPQDVATYVIKASRGVGLTDRIRNLFPYMAARELWDAIRIADSALPYRHPVQGVVAVTARLKANDVEGAMRAMRRALDVPGSEVLLLRPLMALLAEQPDPELELRCTDIVRDNLARLDPRELVAVIEGGFALRRADLAWLAYRRLATVAPQDPELHVAPVIFAKEWFVLPRRYLGLATEAGSEAIDLRAFYAVTRHLPPWQALWRAVPLAEELSAPMDSAERQRRLQLCLAALQAEEKAGTLDARKGVLYAQVLGVLGRWQDAHAALDQFAARNPAQRRDCLLQHAALYRAQQDFDQAYEALAEYFRLEPHPPLAAWRDMAGTLMSLNQGPYAMGMLEEARGRFPQSDEVRLAMAVLWQLFGFSEEALFCISDLRIALDPRLRVSLLAETGRVVAAQKLARAEQLGEVALPKRQAELLPPAEWTLAWRAGTLGGEDYARELAALPARRGAFFAALTRLKQNWYRARGGGATSDAAAWERCGRDARESATALNELTLLLARQGRTNEARQAAARAVALAPAWSVLWRLDTALTAGDPDVVEQGLRACPRDGELWLAHLVSQGGKVKGDAQWGRDELRQVIAERRYSPGTLVRASDYLMRNGHVEAATAAARAAIRDGEGLLAAYIAGLRCGVATRDRAWIQACAERGAEEAVAPWPFYKLIVGLKAQTGQADTDLVRALEGLDARFPGEQAWAQLLGDVYFQRGETQRALSVLEQAIARGGSARTAPLKTLLLAAESARLEGHLDRSIEILEAAYAAHPKDANVLNNLIYNLAQTPKTLPRAALLLPDLVKLGPPTFAVYDTAAMVTLRAGDLRQAEAYMGKALGMVKEGDYAWHEVYLNAAEVQMRAGHLADARAKLQAIRNSPKRSPAAEARARELLDEVVRLEAQKKAGVR
jgi:tetratricopeptide (TPR) repeat protein